MKFEMNLAFCVLLVLLTGSAQTGGQISALPPVFTLAPLQSHTGPSAPPDLTKDPGTEFSQQTHSASPEDETSTEATTINKMEGTVHSQTDAAYKTHVLTTSSAATTSHDMNVPGVMTAHTAATGGLSSTPAVQSAAPQQHISTTEGRATLTTDPLFSTFSSQPAHTEQDTGSTAHAASTVQPQSDSLTTASGPALTPATGRRPARPTHRDAPSELNVGDEELKGPRSPLDPLLAGLLSVFIVTTAVVFVVLFLKFRQRTNHPEFHRLQDLPMDDLMEDTPLSRYTY